MSKLKRPTKSTIIYDNCTMLSPEGEFMAQCSKKRMQWYLKRNLATLVSENEFRLRFAPNGKGHCNDLQYFKEPRQNICVICGTTTNLTQHHIVPSCYRRHLPDKYKNRNSFDVVTMCHEHHDAYEQIAEGEKKEWIKRMGIIETSHDTQRDPAIKFIGILSALLYPKQEIPERAVESLKKKIVEHLGRECSVDELKVLYEQLLNEQKKPSQVDFNEQVMKKYLAEGKDYFDFVVWWRKHFLEHTTPKFLNIHWIEGHLTQGR